MKMTRGEFLALLTAPLFKPLADLIPNDKKEIEVDDAVVEKLEPMTFQLPVAGQSGEVFLVMTQEGEAINCVCNGETWHIISSTDKEITEIPPNSTMTLIGQPYIEGVTNA